MERESRSLTNSGSRGGAGWDGISNLKEDKIVHVSFLYFLDFIAGFLTRVFLS